MIEYDVQRARKYVTELVSIQNAYVKDAKRVDTFAFELRAVTNVTKAARTMLLHHPSEQIPELFYLTIRDKLQADS